MEIYKVNTAAFMMDIIPAGALVFLSLVSETIKRERERESGLDRSVWSARADIQQVDADVSRREGRLICSRGHNLSLSLSLVALLFPLG